MIWSIQSYLIWNFYALKLVQNWFKWHCRTQPIKLFDLAWSTFTNYSPNSTKSSSQLDITQRSLAILQNSLIRLIKPFENSAKFLSIICHKRLIIHENNSYVHVEIARKDFFSGFSKSQVFRGNLQWTYIFSRNRFVINVCQHMLQFHTAAICKWILAFIQVNCWLGSLYLTDIFGTLASVILGGDASVT